MQVVLGLILTEMEFLDKDDKCPEVKLLIKVALKYQKVMMKLRV
jgi:hypothetical protein